jgi:hypothetical protein
MGILTKYVCKNPECENFEKYDHKGFCPECGMKLEKMPNTYVKKLRKDSFNPNRKWRIWLMEIAHRIYMLKLKNTRNMVMN